MRRLLYILFFCFSYSQAQEKQGDANWHLTVADSFDKKGLANATISFKDKKYLISDVYGRVDVPLNIFADGDTIRISCIGYKTTEFKYFRKQPLPDTIALVGSHVVLGEVSISSVASQKMLLGDIKKKYNTHRAPNPSQEFILFIPNENKIKGTIKSIEYVLNDVLKGIDMPFKVNLYTKDKNDLFPDQRLLKDSLIVRNPQKSQHLSVDISRYGIKFPQEGVLVSFETLDTSYYKDSTFYKGPQGQRWIRKMPGIDMDLKQANNYSVDYGKKDRKTSYSMVMGVDAKASPEFLKFTSYVFADGNNLAISLTIIPSSEHLEGNSESLDSGADLIQK